MSEQKICPVCGKPIVSKGSNAQKYCSEQCRRMANRNTKNIIEHNKDLPRGEKYKAYLAYDCKCAICGWQASKFLHYDGRGLSWGFGNELHHIVPVAEGGKAEDGNLILLCPNCHKLAHMGIISREELQRHAKPIDEACKERTEKFFGEESANAVEDWLNSDEFDEEATKNYIVAMQMADLIARAGYTKLNWIWLGWVREIEDAAKEVYFRRGENERGAHM